MLNELYFSFKITNNNEIKCNGEKMNPVINLVTGFSITV